ncbi:MAG: DUF2169 domain-containing protein [Myxococcota bacterium]
MWALDNQTDFAAERNWVRDRNGRHQWIVAVRATYEVAGPAQLSLAEEQRPPALIPEYLGEDGASSLACESDLGPLKPGTDVCVVGQAHACGGKKVPELMVGLSISGHTKSLIVRGENQLVDGPLGLSTTKPIPFETMPVVYERTVGGPIRRTVRLDMRNPIGVGSQVGRPGPNVVYPGDPWAKPAGLGPLCSYWSPRLELAGTYDQQWKEQRFPLLPADYDESFLLCSPVDQRPATRYLLGGEKIGVVNMSPEGPLSFEVPQVRLSMTTAIGFRRERHDAKLVTILIEPDKRRVSCVWQSSLGVSANDHEALDFTTITRA